MTHTKPNACRPNPSPQVHVPDGPGERIDSIISDLADEILLWHFKHPSSPQLDVRAIEGLGADLGIPTLTGKYGDLAGSLRLLGDGLVRELQETLAFPNVDRAEIEVVVRELMTKLMAEVRRPLPSRTVPRSVAGLRNTR